MLDRLCASFRLLCPDSSSLFAGKRFSTLQNEGCDLLMNLPSCYVFASMIAKSGPFCHQEPSAKRTPGKRSMTICVSFSGACLLNCQSLEGTQIVTDLFCAWYRFKKQALGGSLSATCRLGILRVSPSESDVSCNNQYVFRRKGSQNPGEGDHAGRRKRSQVPEPGSVRRVSETLDARS